MNLIFCIEKRLITIPQLTDTQIENKDRKCYLSWKRKEKKEALNRVKNVILINMSMCQVVDTDTGKFEIVELHEDVSIFFSVKKI